MMIDLLREFLQIKVNSLKWFFRFRIQSQKQNKPSRGNTTGEAAASLRWSPKLKLILTLRARGAHISVLHYASRYWPKLPSLTWYNNQIFWNFGKDISKPFAKIKEISIPLGENSWSAPRIICVFIKIPL